uniref:Uncharacterized protein MANES_17G113000 n=1 Tax=Rhizophora mucronata TaxID=61149 RepID=A0A2P2K6P5_RHIMU
MGLGGLVTPRITRLLGFCQAEARLSLNCYTKSYCLWHRTDDWGWWKFANS